MNIGRHIVSKRAGQNIRSVFIRKKPGVKTARPFRICSSVQYYKEIRHDYKPARSRVSIPRNPAKRPRTRHSRLNTPVATTVPVSGYIVRDAFRPDTVFLTTCLPVFVIRASNLSPGRQSPKNGPANMSSITAVSLRAETGRKSVTS